ncbi:MAG: 50S ribosomal protein L11 methyltransferase [Candidatus Magnetomorum sp.]|nr:50S ribosomal protein L11 methyltransferase [Candidatus Magnetomorum sp.]
MDNTYQELTVRVTLLWEDIWGAYCFDCGASGIETKDEENSYKILKIYFTDMSINASHVFDSFFQQYPLEKEDLIWINSEIQHNKDWLMEWKRFFHPITVGNKFIVCPPWEVPDHRDECHKIIINPGNGFGSGSHPSTVLALRLLEAYVEGGDHPLKSILDVGTGSGILLIASKYLGLKQMVGLDIDLPSIYDAQNNFTINQMTGEMISLCGGPECVNYPFDIVISNMMLHELVPVQNELVKNMRQTGALILSGFYRFQKENILQCFSDLQPVLEMTHDEWCGVVMKYSS